MPAEVLLSSALAAIGLMSLLAFLLVFVNIPWEWSMFMDDTLYNTWMPHTTNLTRVIGNEITAYWQLGRFYPVKYVANILKWHYLPNDPYVFRYFNLGVFLLSVVFAVAAVFRASGERLKREAAPLFIFLVGSAFLHKPLLETISINPLGETWVFFFFSLGALFFFSRAPWARYFLARVCFVLVALSKEPAALVFFSGGLYYSYLAWRDRGSRGKYLLNGILDFGLFAFFLGLALYAMSQGSFTKGAYFATTPWMRYAHDFLYKVARYFVWTSPFVVLFLLSWRKLKELLSERYLALSAAALFFGAYGFSYMVFMSTQGIVAYQEIPASMGYFCLFSLLFLWLYRLGLPRSRGLLALLLVLFAASDFVSVSRWERFVRGIVEPRRAMENLLSTGGPMTVLVPVGEISGHISVMIKSLNPQARTFEMDPDLEKNSAKFVGKVYAFEFPFYMGNLPPAILNSAKEVAGGWATISDGKSYRIYRGLREFPAK